MNFVCVFWNSEKIWKKVMQGVIACKVKCTFMFNFDSIGKKTIFWENFESEKHVGDSLEMSNPTCLNRGYNLQDPLLDPHFFIVTTKWIQVILIFEQFDSFWSKAYNDKFTQR